ncbi:MAG: transposase, partial [Candidatus Portnoybacteria bacterium CG_4_10_14_0_2_um_filter_44_20]
MDMQSRNQYLIELRTEYLKTKSRKKRGGLLDEAEKRTKLNRKYLMDKLKPKSNLDKIVSEKKKRKQYYDNSIKPALVRMWQIFDYSCGQRLETSLRDETDRLRLQNELICSGEVALKLKKMGSATIDRKLKHQKEIERIRRKYQRKIHPLLYRQIPVKVFEEQDRSALGNMQIDLVEHCGASASGEFVNTLNATDIYSGWTEQEAVMGKGQENTKNGIDNARARCPFSWQEIHSDGGTEFINAHLFKYSKDSGLDFSRSRPYKKNDNCLIEQKNHTHVRRLVGYSRYDTLKERDLLNDLYRNEWRLYKNFFQPVIKLVLKERVGGKIHRVYDKPKTPYQRLLGSDIP